jgi:hypothetical protein
MIFGLARLLFRTKRSVANKTLPLDLSFYARSFKRTLSIMFGQYCIPIASAFRSWWFMEDNSVILFVEN